MSTAIGDGFMLARLLEMLLEVLAFCLSVIYLLLTNLSQRVNSSQVS